MFALMTSAKDQIMKALQDKEYRQLYVDENISTGIAVQLRELRESRGWTQAELGQHAGGIRQERISQLEDPEYGRPTLTTLRRLAAAFDVALIVRFAAFGELVDWTINLTPEQLTPPSFEDEMAIPTGVGTTFAGDATQVFAFGGELFQTLQSATFTGVAFAATNVVGDPLAQTIPYRVAERNKFAAMGTAVLPRNQYAEAA